MATGIVDQDQESLQHVLDAWGLHGTYDFLYVYEDQGMQMGAGYAIINFIDPAFVLLFMLCFQHYRFAGHVVPAEVQGLRANTERWLQYADAEACHFQLVAPECVAALGFRPAGLPPDRVTIGEVEPGGWAECAGILPGDELVAINGCSVANMTGDELLWVRKARPLCMAIMRRGYCKEPIVVASAIPSHRAVSAVNAMISPQFREKFRKTKMCVFYTQGRCEAAEGCPFAHTQDELLPAPDLSKTKLCYNYFCKRCNDPRCKFAHGSQQLRSGWSRASVDTWSSASTDQVMGANAVGAMSIPPLPVFMGADGMAYDVSMPMSSKDFGAFGWDPSLASVNAAWLVLSGESSTGVEDPTSELASLTASSFSRAASGEAAGGDWCSLRGLRGSQKASEPSSSGDPAEVRVTLRECGTFIELVELKEEATPRRHAWSDGDLPALREALEDSLASCPPLELK